MFANLSRAAARPSAGLLRRAVTATSANAATRINRLSPSAARCSSSLSEVLKAELEEERLVTIDEDVGSMVEKLKKKGMTIKDEPGVSLVKIFGSGVGIEKVLVEFDCDVEGDGDDGWEDDVGDESNQEPGKIEAGNEEVNEEDMAGPGYSFTATITKGNKKMVCTGTATNEISVLGVRVNPASVEWDSSLYRGPIFHELDPDLQEAMVEYLKERGINNELAAFICMYADQKEQTEYTNWLKELHKFVK